MGWLNGFERVPVAERAQGTYTDASPWKIVLHTMEGWLGPSTELFRRNGYAPHFGVSLDKDTYWQYNSTAKASSALRNAAGGTETNRDNAIQVEIEGFAKDSGGWSEAKVLKLVQRVLVPIIRSQPLIAPVVPFEFAKGYRDANERVRLSAAEWDAVSGIVGHCHVPENTHWDPGPFDIDLINRLLTRELAAVDDGVADLGRGATGPAVAELQRNLNFWLKTDLVTDGLFGPKTERAVMRYQNKLRVSETGVWDARSRLANEAFFKFLATLDAATGKRPLVPPPAPPKVALSLGERVTVLEKQMAVLAEKGMV